MTYNPNLPLASDKIRNFPADVTTNNWPRLQTIVSIDHQFNLAAATNDGYHKIVHYVTQAGAFGDGTPAPIPDVGQLYTKTVVNTRHLFYMPGSATLPVREEVSLSACYPRAYVNFDGTGGLGAQTIRQGFNVVSVTKTGTGEYTINLSIPLPLIGPQVAPAIAITGQRLAGSSVIGFVAPGSYNGSVGASTLSIQFVNTSNTLVDVIYGSVIIFCGVN